MKAREIVAGMTVMYGGEPVGVTSTAACGCGCGVQINLANGEYMWCTPHFTVTVVR